jgi:hypothetical protein
MIRSIGRMSGIALVMAIATTLAWAEAQSAGSTAIRTADEMLTRLPEQREPMYLAKPLSYWLRSIQNRDEEMALAFEAIRALGPDAWAAVPELTRIVGAPFAPVRIGVDKRESIVSKLLDIALRSDAIDALAAIGPAGASSAVVLIDWALSVRVIPAYTGGIDSDEVFIDLVTMDVFERMRVAGAVAQFGRGAMPAIVALLGSDDDDERKLAVAILNEKALPIAAVLLKSQDCRARKVGVAILVDMWPVVAREHLLRLKGALVCNSN